MCVDPGRSAGQCSGSSDSDSDSDSEAALCRRVCCGCGLHTSMGCARGLCAAENIFIFINIAFAMYSGALLATAARLAWDPSTYTWFRFLCVTQYRVSTAYVLAAGLYLAALVYLAAAAAAATSRRAASTTRCLHVYCAGVAGLVVSEVCYGAWMCASLATWWRDAPQAELARRGIDLLHDIKPALLAVERYKDVARPLYDIIEEVEREAPNNAIVIAIFGGLGVVLQIAAIVMARKLARQPARSELALTSASEKEASVCRATAAAAASDEDSDSADGSHHQPPGWRKKANLRMYTILDKIF